MAIYFALRLKINKEPSSLRNGDVKGLEEDYGEHGITRAIRVKVTLVPTGLSAGTAELLKVVEDAGILLAHMQIVNLGDEGIECDLYVLVDSPQRLEEELASIPAVKRIRIEDAEGDPLLATLARGFNVVPIMPRMLMDMYEAMGKIVGNVGGTVMSYHIAYRLGEELMELVSTIKKPEGWDEAITYTERIFGKTGLGDLEMRKVSDDPLELEATIKPLKTPLSEIASSMFRGIATGSIAKATGRRLATDLARPAKEGRMKFKIHETRMKGLFANIV